MTYQIGQDVTVMFDGIEHQAEIENVGNGWYLCRIIIDPAGDYGPVTAQLAPMSTVCVRPDAIKPITRASSVTGKNN